MIRMIRIISIVSLMSMIRMISLGFIIIIDIIFVVMIVDTIMCCSRSPTGPAARKRAYTFAHGSGARCCAASGGKHQGAPPRRAGLAVQSMPRLWRRQRKQHCRSALPCRPAGPCRGPTLADPKHHGAPTIGAPLAARTGRATILSPAQSPIAPKTFKNKIRTIALRSRPLGRCVLRSM